MSLPAKAATYFQAASSGFLVPVLAKIISCFSGSFLSAQNWWLSCQIRLALTMPTMPCAAGDRPGTFSAVYTSSRLTKML